MSRIEPDWLIYGQPDPRKGDENGEFGTSQVVHTWGNDTESNIAGASAILSIL